MKAISIERFGGCDELRKRGLPRPIPAADELLIRVVVAGVSALDAEARRGELVDDSLSFPWTPGFEIAGVVDELGAGCGRFRLGDRVMALLPRGGGYAGFATVREDNAASFPRSLLFEEAATLPLDALAVWRALLAGPDPLDDSSIAIVLGAAGGAGHFAVQIALAAGSRVFVDAQPAHVAFVETFGAVEWLDAGTTAADLAAQTGPRTKILDCRSTSAQFDLLNDEFPHQAVAGIAGMVEQRRLRPRLFKIFDIAQVREAHEALESGVVCGKLALTL